MKKSFLFRPLPKIGFLKLFLVILPLLVGMLFIFINPSNIDASDLLLIAWNPAHELLATGHVAAEYPYPVWTVIVMLPVVLWSQKTAMLIWLACNLLMLAASLALLVTSFEWELSPFLLGLIISLSVYFLPTLTSMWLGQLSIFSLLILALTIHFFLHQRWAWLGIVLGLSFIKPQVMIFLVGLILVWALWQRRWQVLFGFGGVVAVLTLISLPFISSPSQIIGGGISSHLGTYILRTSTIWGLCLSLGAPWVLPLIISLGLMLWLGWTWLPILRINALSHQQVLLSFSVAILVNLIALPYSWMHNLTILLLPLGYSASMALKLKGFARILWLTLLFVVMHPLMVALFVLLSGEDNTQAFQIIPALIVIPTMLFLQKVTTKQAS